MPEHNTLHADGVTSSEWSTLRSLRSRSEHVGWRDPVWMTSSHTAMDFTIQKVVYK